MKGKRTLNFTPLLISDVSSQRQKKESTNTSKITDFGHFQGFVAARIFVSTDYFNFEILEFFLEATKLQF